MRFLAPAWLWGVAAAILAYGFALWDERVRARRFERFASHSLWSAIAPQARPANRLRKARVWVAAMVFVFIAMARPQWGTHEETVKVSGMDIMLALDVSNSMEVEDVIPSRLKKAKHWVRGFAEQLRGDRLGLVAFAASAYVACPLTTDIDYVLATLEIMSPKMILNQGTDLKAALETARRSLERAAEDTGGDPNKTGSRDAATQAILLITDGENQEEPALAEAQKLRDAGIKLFVLGVGTEKGGPIPVRDDQGTQRGFKRDHSGQPIISRYNPEELTKLAAAGGGKYFNITEGEDEALTILTELGSANRSEFAERSFLVYEDRFQYPLAIAILLLLIELAIPARAMAALAAIALLSVASPRASAKEPPIGAYLDNEKGLKAFKDGKLEEAKRRFGSAQAQDPSLPELRFNQGIAEMGEGKVDEAAESFRQAAKDGIKGGSPSTASQSLFNLGGALAQKGDVDGAARAYLGALSAARKGGDEALQNDIRKNLELLQQEREKQKQQQQQQQNQDQKQDQKQDEKEKNKKDQSGEGQPKDKDKDKDRDQDKNKDGQDKKEQQKNYKSNQKQGFKSSKLNKEDADRVMSELKDKENELRMKLNRNGKPQNNDRDW